MTISSRLWPMMSAALAAAVLAGASAQAQQGAPGARAQPAPSAKGAPARDATAPGDAGLRQRVEQLEEQLVDMQVVIGTLESLAKGATAPAAAAGGRPNAGAAAALNAADAGRLDSLETQLQALAAQIENLQEQMRALAAGRSGALAPSSSMAVADPPQPPARQGQGPRGSDAGGFGSTIISAGGSVGRDNPDDPLASRPPGVPPGPRVAAAPPMGGPAEADAAPKQLYETAYGYLLQRDYGAAESAFDDFLQRYPNDPLAGNAQYWLGESLYVRGQYRAAAGAFLKGYQTYGRNPKAPESLLKLGMSLQRLGQKDAACSSFNELSTKYPTAPAHVRTTVQTERQRAGCL